MQYIDDSALDSLEHWSEELSKLSKEKVIDQKELEDLKSKVNECKEELTKSDSMGESLRFLISQQLNEILESISLYELCVLRFWRIH